MIEPFFFTYLKFKLAQVCATSYCLVICVQAETRNCFNCWSYDCIDIKYKLNERVDYMTVSCLKQVLYKLAYTESCKRDVASECAKR